MTGLLPKRILHTKTMHEVSDSLNSSARVTGLLPVLAVNKDEDIRIREAALEVFSKRGYPERNDEEYKYSPAGKIFSTFTSSETGVSPVVADLPSGIRISFSGSAIIISGDVRLPQGFIVCTLQDALEQKHPAAIKYLNKLFGQPEDSLLALNISEALTGLFIYAPVKCILPEVLHIIYPESSAENTLLNLRNLFVFSDQSECNISEYWLCSSKQNQGLTWSSEIVLEGSARLNIYKNQFAENGAVLFDHTHAQVLGKGVLKTATLSHGGKWIRNNLTIELLSSHAEVHLNGLFSTSDKQHVDHHTAVIHAEPHCNSFQLYKGVLQQQSSGVFNGKILVRRDAQKTNAYQSSQNLVLGNHASINAKPQLEIFADDVKCSHGSSTGKIDHDALFYLRCRGLSEESAKRLLIDAFSSQVLDTIEDDAIKAFATGRIFSDSI